VEVEEAEARRRARRTASRGGGGGGGGHVLSGKKVEMPLRATINQYKT